jgi:hypothetical protein
MTENGFNGLILSDRVLAPVYPNEWLSLIAKSSFFLCLPGTTIPFCHNLTEAMAVLTIPILSYEHQLPKGLKHGVNCLSYKNNNELIQVIEEAINMTDPQLDMMREELHKYFDQVIDHKIFVDQVLKLKPHKIYLNAEFYSLMCLDKEQNTTHTIR